MYEMIRTVNCSDLGMDGKVRNSAVIDFLQDCSIIHLERHPVMSPFFKQENCVMFLSSRQIDIIRKPQFGEKLRIKTYIFEINRIYGSRNTIIYDEKEDVIVKSCAVGVFMDKTEQKLKKAPGELIDRVKLYPKFDMEFLPRKITAPNVKPVKFSPVNVLKCFIDMNYHVNNARYIDITDEYLPENSQVQRIRIEYKKPLKRGDTAVASVYSRDKNITVDLADENGLSYCTVEYTIA